MLSWCLHRNQTTPRRDERGDYCRCLGCGARIEWSWERRVAVQRVEHVRRFGWNPSSRLSAKAKH